MERRPTTKLEIYTPVQFGILFYIEVQLKNCVVASIYTVKSVYFLVQLSNMLQFIFPTSAAAFARGSH